MKAACRALFVRTGNSARSITFCDAVASEPCPAFPGKQVRAHWPLPDPAAVDGSEEPELRAIGQA